MSKNAMYIGRQLRFLRLQHNLSREAIGDILGVSLSTVIRIEQNKRSISLSEVWTLSNHFKVAISYFMDQTISLPKLNE